MTGDSRLRLFPILVKGSTDRYLIIRRDTGKMLQTTAGGIESVRLLQQGLTIDGTRAVMGARHGCAAADVDIMPLVNNLIAADFVEAIDDRVISTRSRPALWALWWRYGTYWFAQFLSIVIQKAPIGVSARLVLRRRPSRDPALVKQIELNMRCLPRLVLPDADRARAAADNGAILRGFYFERLLLAGLPPATLDHWIRSRARINGLAHLDEALGSGRGAILCAFHVRSYSVIPFVLASRGYAHTVLMDATDDSAREIRGRITRLRDAGYPYEIEPVAAHRNVRTVLRRLQQGQIALLLFDATVTPSQQFASVPFLGASLRVARGVGWLAARASAEVLPVSIRSEGTGRYCLDIRPPLTEAERSTEEATLAALARALERDVLAQPASWLKWKDFHIMVEHKSGQYEQGVTHG